MLRRDLETLLAYLAENAGRYSLDALRAQMVKAGHSPAAADRAVRTFQGVEPQPEPPSWPGVVAVTAADAALVGLAVLLFSNAHKQGGCVTVALLPILCLAEFVVGLGLLASTSQKQRRLGNALFFGVLAFFGLSLAVVAIWGAVAASRM